MRLGAARAGQVEALLSFHEFMAERDLCRALRRLPVICVCEVVRDLPHRGSSTTATFATRTASGTERLGLESYSESLMPESCKGCIEVLYM